MISRRLTFRVALETFPAQFNQDIPPPDRRYILPTSTFGSI